MLVKRSIVEKWYQTDSWVYKNFSYLFKNPLWQKRVPRGFSVCPYFWLSMFSLLLFRPFFVAPIKYVVSPLIKVMGKPAKAVDNFCKMIMSKIWFTESQLDGMPVGFSTLTFFMFVLVGAAILAFLLLLGMKALALYAILKATSLGVFAWWSCVSFIALWGVLITHKKFTNTDCATMNYLWVWLVLFFIAAIIFIPAELVAGIGVVWAATVHVFTMVGMGIWIGLTKITGWIWAAVKAASHFMLSVAFWKPIGMLMLPWWGFVIVLSVMGWAADRFFGNWQEKQWNNLRQENEQEYLSRLRKAWVDLFTRTLIQNKVWLKGTCFDEDGNFGFYQAKATKVIRYDLYRAAFESMWKDKLNELQKDYPSLNDETWKAMGKADNSFERFRLIGKGLAFSVDEFMSHVVDVSRTEFKDTINELVAEYEKEAKRLEDRRNSKLKSWSHLTCLKVTHGIGNGAKSVGRGICKIGRAIRFCFVEGWTLVVYLWTLLKAKKQGVCPYFVFTEPARQTVVVNNKP